MTMSGVQFKMRQRIIQKFENVGATSKKTAVTFIVANLDLQEQYWLPYLVGNLLGNIRKIGVCTSIFICCFHCFSWQVCGDKSRHTI